MTLQEQKLKSGLLCSISCQQRLLVVILVAADRAHSWVATFNLRSGQSEVLLFGAWLIHLRLTLA